ncbi:MAG: N-acetylmuramoyl-L-alanine amidase [Thermotogae bacterium]|nr:N-acetylmuramoyl-L-alanine amidase [Thermotogota bacterium]
MRVLIDPGHGGHSLGTTEGCVPEKDINLQVALRLRERLKDWEVMLTRDDDRYLSLRDRVRLQEELKPDVFLSIHHNAHEMHVEDRSEIYVGWSVVSPSYDLAYIMYDELGRLMPGRRMLPPLPSTYTVVLGPAPVKLLTELFFAREMNGRKMEVEVEVMERALRRFASLEPVSRPDPRWAWGRWAFRPGRRTTPTAVEYPKDTPVSPDRVVILRDGRAFWYGLYLAREWGATYIHTGMSMQERDLHITLRLDGFRGTAILLDWGEPRVSYYHTSGESEALARALADALGYPMAFASDYLLIHLYGARLKVSARWDGESIARLARALIRLTA